MGRPSATKAVSAAPDRRSTIQPSPNSERTPASRVSTLSPTKSRAPATPASRTAASTTPRTTTRPLTSSLRAAGISEGKKRLSTIPASPAVNIEASEDDKENAKPARPPLGTRQSTRSVVLQQRVREFELVNEMLQAAMAAEDDGDMKKQERLEEEVSESMTKLRNDIDRVRAFEKQHGRTPTELELSADSRTERELTVVAASSAKDLKAELEESQAKVTALTREVEDMQSKMTEFGIAAEAEASNVESAKEAIRAEIVDLQKQLEDARVTVTRAKEDYQLQMDNSDRELNGRNNVIRSLQDELERLKHSHEDLEAAVESKDKELREVVSAHEGTAGEHSVEMRQLRQEHGRSIASLNSAQEATIESKDQEIQKLGNVIEQLQHEIQLVHDAKLDAEDLALEKLKEEHHKAISDLMSNHQADLETHKSQIVQQHETYLSHTKAEHEAHMSKIRTENEHQLSKNKAEHGRELQTREEVVTSTKAELGKVLAAKTGSEILVDKLRIESEALQGAAAQAHTALKSTQADLEAARTQVTSLQQVLETLEQERIDKDGHHASLLKKAKSDAEEAVRAMNESEKNEQASRNETVMSELQAARTQVTSLQQVLENLDRESVDKDEHHASLIKKAKSDAEEAAEHHTNLLEKAKADAEEAARALHESDKSELMLKHETAISELQAQYDESVSQIRAEMERASAQHAIELKAKQDELAEASADMDAKSAKEAGEVQALQDEMTKIHADMADSSAKHEDRVRQLDAAKDEVERRLQLELSKTQEDAEESRKQLGKAQGENRRLELELTNLQDDSKTSGSLAAELQAKFAKAQEDAVESSKLAEKLQAEMIKTQEEAKESSKLAERLQAEMIKAQEEAKESTKLADDRQAEIATAQENAMQSNKLAADLQTKVDNDQESILKLTRVAEEATKAIDLSDRTNALKRTPESESSAFRTLRQELEGALQELETQRTLNDKAEEAAEQSKIKIRELEASLKVTKAELTESKTARANGIDFLRSPTGNFGGGIGSPGLENSKWATAESMAPNKTDGEDRGAAIQGTMAGIQEQVRQLAVINDDFLDDHAR